MKIHIKTKKKTLFEESENMNTYWILEVKEYLTFKDIFIEEII